jgi:hypothetical protein
VWSVFGLGVVWCGSRVGFDFGFQCEYKLAMRMVPDRHRYANERSL